MRSRILAVGVLSVAVGLLVVSVLRGTRSEKPPAAAPAAERAIRQPAAPRAAPVARRSEAPGPVAAVPRIDAAVRVPSTEIYENAANLKLLADALEPRAAAGDAEAARSLARILDECAPMSLFPNYVEGFRERLPTFAPERRGAASRRPARTTLHRSGQGRQDLAATGA